MIVRRPIKIYQSRKHLFATLLLVFTPFIFLLVFSRFFNITIIHLFRDIFMSVSRLFAAYLVAVIFAWISAALFYRGRWATIMLPVFDVLQSIPTFSALPMVILFWGASDFIVILFLFLAVVWPLFFSIISSLKLIRRDWREAATIYNLKGLNNIRYFLGPASIPGLITGSIIGLGDGWEALVATEIITGIKSGLGNFFQTFSSDPTVTAFGILGLLLIIFSINKLIWLPLLEKSHQLTSE